MPLWRSHLLTTIFTTRLGLNQHQQCMPADTGTRTARTDGCSPKDPDTWLTQAACALSRVHGRRELYTHLERDRSVPQDGTPRIRSFPACQTRQQTSERVEIRHDPRGRRGVRCPGPPSRLSRTGGGGTHTRTPRRRPPATTYVILSRRYIHIYVYI